MAKDLPLHCVRACMHACVRTAHVHVSKIRVSHVHWKSGNISETMLDRDVVTTGH